MPENEVQFPKEMSDMEKLVHGMAHYMGRWPLESEVYDFIMGDMEKREAILNNAG